MKCVINDNELLPEAIAIEHGSVGDYYVQDYARVELTNKNSIITEVHFMEFLFELTKLINLMSRNSISEYSAEMLISGEVFDATINRDRINLLLYDISNRAQRRYTMTLGELIQLHRIMKSVLIDSLRASGIKFDDLKQRDLISLVD